MSILLVCAQVIAGDTEWGAFNRNLAEAVVLDCAHFIVAGFSCLLSYAVP